MTDDELAKLLTAIGALCLVPYPFPPGSNHNEHLVIALGEIHGIVRKAIHNFNNPPEK